MPSERIQRQIERLLDEAEVALSRREWPRVRELSEDVLALDPENADERTLLDAAVRAGADTQPTSSKSSGPLAEPATANAPLPTSFADGRYAVRRFLGEGGRKRVYLAHDVKLDRDVAYAAIKTDGLDAGGVTRIRREAQAMGRLGDHPHIVTVFDTGEETRPDGVIEPYIVSQFMAGGELSRVIDEADRRRLPIADAVRIGAQIALGLQHAHAHGIVHRDLKPGNVWLTDTGVVKIGDFGLALSLDRTRMTMAGTMVGTAAYMPPEQAMGGATTAASDLYALGCIIYEMVAGRPPFVGDDAVAVISQHLNTPPVSPAWHTPECPTGLDTLITRLLAKDPAQRPASAAAVVEALASVDVQSAPVAPPAPADQPPSEAIYQRTFVGREAELKQLQGAFDAALSGQGGLIMVVGEPGIGKTTVTEQLLTYVAMRGGHSLVGHCYEEGSLALPYLPFVEAMRSYVLSHEKEQLQSELGTGAGEVARIVSEIRDRVAVEPPPRATRRRSDSGSSRRSRRSCATHRARSRCASCSKTCRTATRAPWSCSSTWPATSPAPAS